MIEIISKETIDELISDALPDGTGVVNEKAYQRLVETLGSSHEPCMGNEISATDSIEETMENFKRMRKANELMRKLLKGE